VAVSVEDAIESIFGRGLNVAGDLHDLFKSLALVLTVGEAETGASDTRQRFGPTKERLFRNRVHRQTLATSTRAT
jgi:hypothetical protein